MRLLLTLLPLLSLLSTASTQTVYDIPSSDSCSGYVFSSSDLSTAAYAALSDLNSGTTQGSDSYPHQYNDYEDIDFPDCQSPFYEYPVFKGKSKCSCLLSLFGAGGEGDEIEGERNQA